MPSWRFPAFVSANWLPAGLLGLIAAALWAGASPVRAVSALGIVYACGYVTGALLVKPTHDRTSTALALVRLVSGLFLTSVAFLLSLRLSWPWFTGPAALLCVSVLRHRRHAFLPPRPVTTATVGGVLASLITAVLLLPPAVSALRMAPGEFPPVFFNVDVPYFLEKVHALVQADVYPPPSLGVLDGVRPYHFGLHGVAAFVARGSGLAPHHAVFLILVPLLLAAIAAAATLLAWTLAPSMPAVLTVPLLIVTTPTLWYDYWQNVTPRLQDAWTTGSIGPLDSLASNWEMWGVTSNIQNLAAHFLVLATVAASARATAIGWGLACFLAGSAVLFKSPAGVALMAGLCLARAWRALADRSVRPLAAAAGAVAVFAFVYGVFWLALPIPGELRAVVAPLFQIEYAATHGGVTWFVLDVAWLLLPALVVLPALRLERNAPGLWLLAFAAGPFLVVNTLRLVDLRREFGVSSMNEDDWRQIMMPIPLLLHAAVLGVVGHRWLRVGHLARVMCAAAVVVTVLPAAWVAARYAGLLVDLPEQGHEYADNRALGDALAVVPVDGSVVVTNDLRYPAEGFRRDERQMQIPALFGHQAFAVNYFYESYPFSPARREMQALLQGRDWTPAIEEAARTHGWTHFVVHLPYAHPEPLPLERVFDNGTYAVFRFPR